MSWTANFYREWLPLLWPPSIERLRQYVLAGGDGEDFYVRLYKWGKVHLRGKGGGDYRMLYTTFILGGAPPLLPNCNTIIDLGGNIGLSTIYLARSLRDARFYVVEAATENLEALERNLAPLGERVRIDHAAVWRSNEAVFIQPPDHEGSYGAFRCISAGKGESVQGFTMDAILDRSGFERVDLVKMDIEGAEAGVFVNSNWLNRVNALTVEFHGNARSESDFDAVIARHGMQIAAELPNRGVLAVRPF